MIPSGPQPVYYQIRFMRRRFRPRHRLAAGRLDAAPLVNIALLLFLFYMVGSPFVLQPGVIVNLPGSSFHAGAPYGAMVVTISQEGMVFFNDERTTVKGLAAAFQQAAHDAPDSTLVIEADGGVRHSLLVDIYNMAEAAGIRRVALATRVTAPAATGP